jgi:hypothetical protein
MRKIFISALIVLATCAAGLGQEDTSKYTVEQLARLAVAPAAKDGLGRAVIAVADESGNPIPDADVTLESKWGGNELCESFGGTNSHGAIALLPIHMGDLKLTIKAKGFVTTRMVVAREDLGRPIHVEMHRK